MARFWALVTAVAAIVHSQPLSGIIYQYSCTLRRLCWWWCCLSTRSWTLHTRRAYDTLAIRPGPRQPVDYAAAKTSRRLFGRSVTSVGVRARASGRSLLFTATGRRRRGRGKGYFLLLLLLLRNRRGRVDRLRSLKLRRRRRRLRSVGARRSGTPTVAPPHPPRLIS